MRETNKNPPQVLPAVDFFMAVCEQLQIGDKTMNNEWDDDAAGWDIDSTVAEYADKAYRRF